MCEKGFNERMFFHQDLLENDDTEAGEVMQCLIDNKRHHDMDVKCRAGIEHKQLVSETPLVDTLHLMCVCVLVSVCATSFVFLEIIRLYDNGVDFVTRLQVFAQVQAGM